MKKMLAVMFVAAAALMLLTGCPGGGGTKTGSPNVDKAMDEMQYDKAKTLGALARKVQVAQFTMDFDTLWSLMDKESLKSFDERLAKDKENVDKWLKQAEESLNTAANEEDKKRAQEEVDRYKMEKDVLAKITSGKDYFKYERSPNMVVIGEEFSQDGNTGWLKMKNTKNGREFKGQEFVKEDGQWKMKD